MHHILYEGLITDCRQGSGGSEVLVYDEGSLSMLDFQQGMFFPPLGSLMLQFRSASFQLLSDQLVFHCADTDWMVGVVSDSVREKLLSWIASVNARLATE